MATYEDERLAISARYLPETREIEVVLDDGSRHAWPVDRLEMLKRTSNGFEPLLNPPADLLADVKVYGGGSSIYWEKLEQIFAVDELLAGIYGRKKWMESLTTLAAV
ncbi:MAG: DUF2442 domain-containing protein [Cyanobacteria bacterium J06623_5]